MKEMLLKTNFIRDTYTSIHRQPLHQVQPHGRTRVQLLCLPLLPAFLVQDRIVDFLNTSPWSSLFVILLSGFRYSIPSSLFSILLCRPPLPLSSSFRLETAWRILTTSTVRVVWYVALHLYDLRENL